VNSQVNKNTDNFIYNYLQQQDLIGTNRLILRQGTVSSMDYYTFTRVMEQPSS